jgi:hypothetical protein
MLCCIVEIACLVFGIVTLVRGKFNLSGSRVVEGGPARLIGVLLLLPLILGQGGEFVYGLYKGVQLGARGQQPDMAKLQQELLVPALIINAIGGGIPLILALVIALTNAQPVRPKPELDEFDEEEEDDRPSRRRDRDEEEDEDDRPRRRSRSEDEEEDDEPDDRIRRK